MKYLILALTFGIAHAALAACDPVPMTDQQIRDAYAVVQKIDSDSPAEQQKDFQIIQNDPSTTGSFASVADMLAYCKTYLKTSVDQYIEIEHEYAAQCESPNGSGGRKFEQPGTCYAMPMCNGASAPAPNGSIDCKFSDMSYRDYFGTCRSL